MSKMTMSGLQSAMASYVDAAKQAGAWSPTVTSFTGLLDKIGKQVTFDGTFNDKLPELDGDDLPYGKTIEEWFIDLTMPTAYSDIESEGAKDIEPALPSVEEVVYSYSLGREKVKTTIPYNDFERACLGASQAGSVSAKIMERLQNSYDLTKYAEKKQLLGNAADKAVACGRVSEIASPADTATGEAFIKQVKVDVEAASFAHEQVVTPAEGSDPEVSALVGAAPGLTLYIKKGIMPSVEVDTMAGAFNQEKLALPCTIKVLDDFGTMVNSDVYAILVDTRGVKLHNGYNALRSKENADGDFINFVKHFEHTGFISKYCYCKAYSEPSE